MITSTNGSTSDRRVGDRRAGDRRVGDRRVDDRRAGDRRAGARGRRRRLAALVFAPVAVALLALALARDAAADKVREPSASGGPPGPTPLADPPAELIEAPVDPAAPTLPEPRSVTVQEIDAPAPAPATPPSSAPAPTRSAEPAADDAGTFTLSLRIPILLVITGVAALGLLIVRAIRRRRAAA